MSNEFRVFGPPGTGKTTKLATEIVPMLAEKYGADKVMLTSFTKAAAIELSQRIDSNDSSTIGTLHSICYKALQCPPLTEEHIYEWNELNGSYSLAYGNKTGPRLFSEYQIYRNKMIPEAKWTKEVQHFAKAWNDWKNKNFLLDFIDLIERAGQLIAPPGNPSVILIDEAQDFTKLEMSVLRQWAMQCHELWVVGDEDQALYSFSGASPENMLKPEIDQNKKIILDQSYRIPRTVHALAEKLIKRVTIREPKEYKPRDFEGSVTYGSGNFSSPEWVVSEILKREGTSMIVASCNYMLDDIINQLMSKGIPFSNPWRKETKTWNPLSTVGAETIISFIQTGEDAEYWSTHQFLQWAPNIRVGKEGIIRKHGKEGIKQIQDIIDDDPGTPGLHTCREYIHDILTPIAIEKCIARDVQWLKDNVTAKAKREISFPARIFSKNGKEALLHPPKIFIGTIHSFKGTEADNVFLYPDISFASVKEMEFKEGYDNLCRLFYVGITRTKENLILMPPATSNFFDI